MVGCPECERLLATYHGLVHDQTILLSQHSEAVATGDGSRIAALSAALNASREFCEQGWQQFKEHEAIHGKRSASAKG